jgi:hypothetical protein
MDSVTLKRVREALKPYRPYSFKYKDVTFYLNFNPRKGICTECKDITTKTHLHHTKYDDDHPLENTIELCETCHGKLTYNQTRLTLKESLEILIRTGKEVKQRKIV